MLGIIIIDKPQWLTSHDVISQVRRKLNIKRVGHAGTLDPMATGILVVAIGPATRFLQYLDLEPKHYTGTVKFGAVTTTQDIEGEIVAEKKIPLNLKALIKLHKEKLLGNICQIPPMFSAVKKDGRPLYEYARKGIEIERRERQTTIFSFELKLVNEDSAEFEVICSRGTYVRTLLHDLGQSVGCGAHLTSLRRTQAGNYTLSQAVVINEIIPEKITPLLDGLKHLPIFTLNSSSIFDIRLGRSLKIDEPFSEAQNYVLTDDEGKVIAMAEYQKGRLQPICVIPS